MQQPSATDAATSREGVQSARQDVPVGAKFAEALGRKDFDAIVGLLDPQIDFRGLTPGRVWEVATASAVVDEVLRRWFEDTDVLDEILSIETDHFADRHRVSYRFRGHNAEGPFVVEQQAYYAEEGGVINYMRVLCSGFRPN